jgi:succinate-semialdehyde dehydrogenase/glutarate-semialdehyde dehydrogenase
MAGDDVSMDDAAALASAPTDLYISGRWRPSSSNERFAVQDPATEETLAEVADATPADGEAALAAAADAQPAWGRTPPQERSDILGRAFDTVMERIEPLAALMTLEMGKPIADSKAEITYAAGFLRWFSEEAVRLDGRYTTAPDGRSRLLVLERPVGPCLLVTPWNFPLAMGTRKIGPALAAGCTAVVKPAQQTPLSMLAFARILEEVGLPPGVVNVIPTTDAGGVVEPLLGDGRLRKLSFTGSTTVGRRLQGLAAEQLLRTSMELGGNAPFLVFEDADVGAAVDAAVLAKMRNMGEACTAANRFLVHRSLAEDFTGALAARLGGMKVGHGRDDGVEVGPLIDEKAVRKVEELVADAVDRGARVVLEGGRVDRPGHFHTPVVLADVPGGARILKEEVFGPVAPIVSFDSDEEAIALANDTEYGLVAYACTKDLDRTVRLSEELDVGMIGVNRGLVSTPAAPFGGVKQSGFGREGGAEGIREYLSPRFVNLNA